MTGSDVARPKPPRRRVNERYARPLFLLTILTGSFLLFLTQPMIARMALPRVGGAPAVWNSAMLVYQLLLLAGYAYAHWPVPAAAAAAGRHPSRPARRSPPCGCRSA